VCASCSLSGRAHLGGKAVVSRASVRRVAAATPLQVQAARTVESKKEVVAGLKEQVEKSLLVAGMQYQGLSVRVRAPPFIPFIPSSFASTHSPAARFRTAL